MEAKWITPSHRGGQEVYLPHCSHCKAIANMKWHFCPSCGFEMKNPIPYRYKYSDEVKKDEDIS